MKANLLLRKLLPATLLAIGLAGCGGGDKPADKNSTAQGANPGGDGAAKSTTVELAAFIKGKRVWMVEPEDMGGGESAEPPDPRDPSSESKANESSPDKSGDECEVPAEKAEGPPSGEADEMFLQFNEDGSLQIGGRNEKGEAVAFPMDPDEKYTYTVKDLVVTVLNNGKDEGAITFSSHEPKAGDEVTLAEKEEDKVTTKITKVEPATNLKAMKFERPDANDPGDSAEPKGDAGADDPTGESPEKK